MISAQRLWVDRLLLGLALSLTGLVLYTSESVTTSELRSRENSVLSAWRQDDLSRIELQGSGARILIERQASEQSGAARWRIKEPYAADADPQTVDELLTTLRFAIWLRPIEAAQADPEALGFANPQRKLLLEMGSLSYELVLGKSVRSPEGAAYLMVTGPGSSQKAVGIVKEQVVKALLVDARAFMGQNFVSAKRSEITKVVLSGPQGKQSWVRSGHRFRFSGAHAEQLIDSQASQPFFFHLARLRAEHFLAQATANKVLEQSDSVSIELWTEAEPSPGKGSAFRLRVGGQCPKQEGMVVVVRDKPLPLAGCTSADVMAGFTLPTDSLLDRTAFSFSSDEVERVVARVGSKRLELVRDGENFLLKAPVQTNVALTQGNQRIEALVGSTGQKLDNPNLTALGLDPPRGGMTLTGLSEVTNSTVDESIQLGATDAEGRLPIRRETDGSVLLMPRATAQAFRVDATLSRSLKLFDFPEDSVSEIHVVTRQLEQKIERAQGDYKLTLPAGFEPDTTLVHALRSALVGLTAERWISDEDNRDFGLDQPILQAELTRQTEAATKSVTLKVGNQIPGGAYATLSTVPGVFIVSSAALRSISTPVLSRSAFVVDPLRFASITLQTSERRVVLHNHGGNFGSNDIGIDRDHAARIIEALENLRPEFAVHTGNAKPEEGFAKPTLTISYEPRVQDEAARVIHIGAAHTFQSMGGFFTRTEQSKATFAISQGRVQQLLDLL